MNHQLRWGSRKNLVQMKQESHMSWQQGQMHLESHKMIGKLLKELYLVVSHMNLELLMIELVPGEIHKSPELGMKLWLGVSHKSPELGPKLGLVGSHKSLELGPKLGLVGNHRNPGLELQLGPGEIHKNPGLGLKLGLVGSHKSPGLEQKLFHRLRVSWKKQIHILKVLG